jgi:hypothetical protein
MPSSPHQVAAVEAIMAEPSAEPIPPDFAEAFAYAVLVYEIWTPRGTLPSSGHGAAHNGMQYQTLEAVAQ